MVTAIADAACGVPSLLAMVGGRANMMMTGAPVQRAQVENLYVEAMVLADEAHAAFAAQRNLGDLRSGAGAQIGLACESLKTTTRLMHVIAWLLHRRAMFAGDPGAGPNDSAARIGDPVAADWDVCAGFDVSVRRIISASERLFERIAAIEAGWDVPEAVTPVQALLAQLEARL
jgi:regulator of CtrA degradation